jgi:hypothetical protein
VCLRTFSWILARHRAPAARSAAPLPEQKPELRAPGVAARPPAAAVAGAAEASASASAETVALAEAEAGEEGGRPTAP